MTLLANNFYGLWIQDFVLVPWKFICLLLILLLIPQNLVKYFLTFVYIFLFIQLGWQYYEKYWSNRKGLDFFILRQGPTFIINTLLKKHGIKGSSKFYEIHVRIDKKYSDMNTYNQAMLNDVKIIRQLMDEGKLNCTLFFNSFNRQAVAALEEAFKGYKVIRVNNLCLVKAFMTGWKGKRFQKRQRRMFGQVKSHRDVGKPEEWDLLLINPAKIF